MKTANIQLAGSYLVKTGQVPTPGVYQNFTNCFSYDVTDQMTGGRRIFLQKRNGYTANSIGVDYTPCRGACIWQSNTSPQIVFSFTNNSDIRVYNQNQSIVGAAFSTQANCLDITDTSVSGTGNIVAILGSVGGTQQAWYYPQGGAWTQITDTEFPPNQTPAIRITSSAVHMDGYMFVMGSDGQIWNSDLNSISSWSANNFISASTIPDPGTGIARSGDSIVGFGKSSIQFFINNGNPSGSPLSTIQEATIRLGVVEGSHKTIGDSTYFIGIPSESSVFGAYELKGRSVKKISTPDIDASFSSVTYCAGQIHTQTGFRHLLFGDSANFITNAYCLDNGRWWKFSAGDNGWRGAALGYASAGGLTYASGYDGSALGLIYNMNTGGDYTDAGQTLTMTIQTMPLDFGTGKYKYPSQVRLFGDKQSSTCNVAMSYSDDFGGNFSTPVNMDMSSNSPAVFNPLGRFRRRIWKFTNTTNLPLRLERFEVDYEVGLT